MQYKPKSDYIRKRPKEPQTEADCLKLCGLAPESEREDYWDKHGDEHARFLVVGASEPPQKVQLWRIMKKVLGFQADLTPQPTGNCVAAAADGVIELIQAIEIGLGEAEEYKPIYNPYHYATGRVLIGKNRLRGGAGSLGGWQAKAIEQYGVIPITNELPAYNKRNCDAWGDDREAEGKSFRDYLNDGAKHVIKSTARVTRVDQVVQSIANLYPLTIAANFGYEMKARDPKGVMRRGSNWAHQMRVVGYDLKNGTVEIPNTWGDVHGQLIDPDDDTLLPKGVIRTDMETFEKHLRNSETIAFSNFQGFPAQKYDFGGWA